MRCVCHIYYTDEEKISCQLQIYNIYTFYITLQRIDLVVLFLASQQTGFGVSNSQQDKPESQMWNKCS